MKTDIFPSGLQSAGNNLFILVTVPPEDKAEPTLAELNAETSIDITCYIPTTAFAVTLDQPTEDDSRWCDKSTRYEFGMPSLNLTEIAHIVDPQGDGTETGNLLLGSLLPNSEYQLYWRLGKDHSAALASGDTVVGFDVSTGEAFTPPLASGKYLRTVKVSLTAATDLDGYKLAV